MTRKYLKENGLIAVPFDKGIGICLMKTESYTKKLEDIINLSTIRESNTTKKKRKTSNLKGRGTCIKYVKTSKTAGENQ